MQLEITTFPNYIIMSDTWIYILRPGYVITIVADILTANIGARSSATTMLTRLWKTTVTWFIFYQYKDCGLHVLQYMNLIEFNNKANHFNTLYSLKSNNNTDKQRVLMHGHQGWNVRHGLCHIYMIYVYIWVVYSFCLFCCLFIIVTTQFVALYKPCKPKPKFR